MLPGLELMGCTGLAVPAEVMQHVVRVESSFNRYAIGVVGGRLERQPRTLAEAVATARMLLDRGYNFSVGLAQVNRHNLAAQGLDDLEAAFDACPNLRAGARILADCHRRASGDWSKALSCYYSGNFETGLRHGYVQKVLASWNGAAAEAAPIPLARQAAANARIDGADGATSLVARRAEAISRQLDPPARAAGPLAPPPGTASPVPAAGEALAPPDLGPVVLQPRGAIAVPPRQPDLPPRPPADEDAAFVF